MEIQQTGNTVSGEGGRGRPGRRRTKYAKHGISTGCRPLLPPLHVAKTDRNNLNEEITPLLPTGIGQRYCQTISINNMQCSCADVTPPTNESAELTQGALQLINYSEGTVFHATSPMSGQQTSALSSQPHDVNKLAMLPI